MAGQYRQGLLLLLLLTSYKKAIRCRRFGGKSATTEHASAQKAGLARASRFGRVNRQGVGIFICSPTVARIADRATAFVINYEAGQKGERTRDSL